MEPNRSRSNWGSREAFAAYHHSSGARIESRRAVRYALEVDVHYTWTERGVKHEARGRTRDMSPKGAFVVAPLCPPQGSLITMSFLMPAIGCESQSVQVQAESKVVRVDLGQRAGRPPGFSVAHVRTMLCAK